jgi:hypothetical protein
MHRCAQALTPSHHVKSLWHACRALDWAVQAQVQLGTGPADARIYPRREALPLPRLGSQPCPALQVCFCGMLIEGKLSAWTNSLRELGWHAKHPGHARWSITLMYLLATLPRGEKKKGKYGSSRQACVLIILSVLRHSALQST